MAPSDASRDNQSKKIKATRPGRSHSNNPIIDLTDDDQPAQSSSRQATLPNPSRRYNTDSEAIDLTEDEPYGSLHGPFEALASGHNNGNQNQRSNGGLLCSEGQQAKPGKPRPLGDPGGSQKARRQVRSGGGNFDPLVISSSDEDDRTTAPAPTQEPSVVRDMQQQTKEQPSQKNQGTLLIARREPISTMEGQSADIASCETVLIGPQMLPGTAEPIDPSSVHEEKADVHSKPSLPPESDTRHRNQTAETPENHQNKDGASLEMEASPTDSGHNLLSLVTSQRAISEDTSDSMPSLEPYEPAAQSGSFARSLTPSRSSDRFPSSVSPRRVREQVARTTEDFIESDLISAVEGSRVDPTEGDVMDVDGEGQVPLVLNSPEHNNAESSIADSDGDIPMDDPFKRNVTENFSIPGTNKKSHRELCGRSPVQDQISAKILDLSSASTSPETSWKKPNTPATLEDVGALWAKQLEKMRKVLGRHTTV